MKNHTSSPIPLEVALFFVQQLPKSYQKAIFDWLSKNESVNEKVNTDVEAKRIPLKFGAGKDLITFVSDDFDEPLDDFDEYM